MNIDISIVEVSFSTCVPYISSDFDIFHDFRLDVSSRSRKCTISVKYCHKSIHWIVSLIVRRDCVCEYRYFNC